MRDVTSDGGGRAIPEATIALGRRLGKRLVAERVETDARLGTIGELGCDEAQAPFSGGRSQRKPQGVFCGPRNVAQASAQPRFARRVLPGRYQIPASRGINSRWLRAPATKFHCYFKVLAPHILRR